MAMREFYIINELDRVFRTSNAIYRIWDFVAVKGLSFTNKCVNPCANILKILEKINNHVLYVVLMLMLNRQSSYLLFIMMVLKRFGRRIWCDCQYDIWDWTCVTQLKTMCTRYTFLTPVANRIACNNKIKKQRVKTYVKHRAYDCRKNMHLWRVHKMT